MPDHDSFGGRSQRAFSLLDLLAAIAITALLAALLLPAVQASQEDAQRLQCANNLNDIGRGFASFEAANGGFPARRLFNPTGGWGPLLLPHVQQAKLGDAFKFTHDFYDPINKAVAETPVSLFLCPASPKRTVPISATASGNSLNPDKDTTYSVDAAANDYISSNGFLMPTTGYGINWPLARRQGTNRHQPMDDNTYLPLSLITDGLSQTLLLVEQAGRPQVWRLGKVANKTDPMNLGRNSRGTWAGFGSIAFRPCNREDGYSFDDSQGDLMTCSVNCNNGQGIYGFHAGGAYVLFCDGSVRFMGESLDGLTFARLAMRDDGQLIATGDY